MNKIDDEIIAGVVRQEEKDRRALAILLDREREKGGCELALRMRMGVTTSYVTAVPLEWVVRKVRFAGDLPIFKGKVDKKSKRVPVDEDTLDDIRQRNPDWRRQLPMTVYMMAQRNHKFPPLLVVGWQDWVHDPSAEQWGPQGRAMRDSVPVTPLDHKSVYVELNHARTNYYVLDGQHRLMAILGMHDLLVKGQLPAMNEHGESMNQGKISLEGIVEEITRRYPDEKDDNSVRQRLQDIMEENIGIEIIPAVIRNEKYRDSLFRLRRTFVDVNETAKSLTKGEITLLDENDGFRIVARRVMTSHLLFNKGEWVELKGNQVKEESDHYTTLDAIVNIARLYLGAKEEFCEWREPFLCDKKLPLVRPEESKIAAGVAKLSEYFDALSQLPSHQRMISGVKAGSIRAKKGKGNDNILFRPIAQMALADAIAKLEKKPGRLSVNDIVAELVRQEGEGQMCLTNPKSPWFGVLCDVVDMKMRRHKKYQHLCSKLFRHLFRGIESGKDSETLQKEFSQARMNSGVEGEDNVTAISLEGTVVKLSKIQLPHPW